MKKYINMLQKKLQMAKRYDSNLGPNCHFQSKFGSLKRRKIKKKYSISMNQKTNQHSPTYKRSLKRRFKKIIIIIIIIKIIIIIISQK